MSNDLDGNNVSQLNAVKTALLNLYTSTKNNMVRMSLYYMIKGHNIIPKTEPYPSGERGAMPYSSMLAAANAIQRANQDLGDVER